MLSVVRADTGLALGVVKSDVAGDVAVEGFVVAEEESALVVQALAGAGGGGVSGAVHDGDGAAGEGMVATRSLFLLRSGRVAGIC